MDRPLVVDASAVVDLLMANRNSTAVAHHLASHNCVAPAHLDLEILSALSRLARANVLAEDAVRRRLQRATAMPMARMPLADLLEDAWARRHNLRIADALYVTLADRLGCPLLTSDARLARADTGVQILTGGDDA